MRTSNRRHPAVIAAVLAIAITALAACGSAKAGGSGGGGGKSVTIDVGLPKKITISKPLKIAYFVAASTNALGASQEAGVKAYAKAHNLDITTFDAAFDANLQFNQIQTAIQSKRYNVLAIWPVDGQTICKEASVTAPAAGLLVTVFDQPLCGRFVKEGNDLWQPGTLNYISGYNTRTTFDQWFEEIHKAYPGPQTVGILEGVPTDGDSQDITNDQAIFAKKYPEYHFVSKLNTVYTSETGYQQALAMIHAHPDLTLMICSASAITAGAARAVDQLGKSGKIKIVDYGGSKQVAALIKAGKVALTIPARPRTEGDYFLKQLQDAIDGKQVPRFTNVPFQVINAQNVDSYHAEY